SLARLLAPPPTRTYTLSLHDALPIFPRSSTASDPVANPAMLPSAPAIRPRHTHPGAVRPRDSPMASRIMPSRKAMPDICRGAARSEEHTSELQSRENLVCRLLLEKKK